MRYRKFYKTLKKIIRTPARYFHIDLGDYRNTLFISGAGRSGTTWLQEIINFDNDYRVIFEPFHPGKVALVRDWNYRQYLRVNESSSKFISPATKILSGKVNNDWVDRYNRRILSRRRIIKDVHTNLLLYWIKHNFPEIPILLIMRHPCAVANSKSNVNWSWESQLDYFLDQHELMEDFLSPFESRIRDAKSSFEQHIFMWCIENYIPLKQFQKGEIYILFYENICTNIQKETENLLSFISRPYSPSVIYMINKPSSTSIKQSAIKTGADLLNSWRKNISDDQIYQAIEILNLFGLNAIYNDNDLPLVNGNELLEII